MRRRAELLRELAGVIDRFLGSITEIRGNQDVLRQHGDLMAFTKRANGGATPSA